MLVAANLGAGAFGNNDAYFRMYRDDLPTLKSWTAARGPANYNARAISTGGEAALFIWQTYQATGDAGFLAQVPGDGRVGGLHARPRQGRPRQLSPH